MEQIQQHEWVVDSGITNHSTCIHCLVKKIKTGHGYFIYSSNGRMRELNEPACITRIINAPQREAEK